MKNNKSETSEHVHMRSILQKYNSQVNATMCATKTAGSKKEIVYEKKVMECTAGADPIFLPRSASAGE